MDDYNFITNEQLERIADECYDELISGTSQEYLVGCIYGLYQDYIISEGQESYLYNIVDPFDMYNEPSKYWEAITDDNPLKKCIGY